MNTKSGKKSRMKELMRRPGSLALFLLTRLFTLLSAGIFLMLILYVLIKGVPHLDFSLFSPVYTSDNVSLLPSLINTVIITLFSLLIAAPLGIGTAIYLVEYAKRGNKLVTVVRSAAETLSGIPSIIYGLFGLLFFVTTLSWGYSLVAGAFTLAIMILPIIMRTTEEALKSVPDMYREGSYGLGAGKLRTIFRIVLPASSPGVISGLVLAVGRIVGETAALMYTAGTVAGLATSPMDSGRTLAVHLYVLASEGLHVGKAYATAVVLLVLVIGINTISAYIARKLNKGMSA